MPIEIRELVIRAVVDPDPEPGREAPADETPAAGRQALVQACVEETLRILRRQRER